MDGSGRITKRNRQFLKQIFPYKSAISSSLVNDKSTNDSRTLLPETDTLSQEVTISDDDFNEGLARAVYNVLNDEITDFQPEAAVKLPPNQLSNTGSATQSSKRVKFATKRFNEQI